MKSANQWKDYELLDTSDGMRLERWGKYTLVRPDPQVIWSAQTDLFSYPKLNAYYKRSEKGAAAGKFCVLSPRNGIFLTTLSISGLKSNPWVSSIRGSSPNRR